MKHIKYGENKYNALKRFHVRFGLMLARAYALCHVARSTLVMLAAKSLDLNPIDKLLDQLKRKVRTQPLQINLRELMRVVHKMCAAIPQQY